MFTDRIDFSNKNRFVESAHYRQIAFIFRSSRTNKMDVQQCESSQLKHLQPKYALCAYAYVLLIKQSSQKLFSHIFHNTI